MATAALSSQAPTVALLPAHPSQVWMLSTVARELAAWAQVRWYLRDKDVSRAIADALHLDYRTLSKAGRGLVGNAAEMALNVGRVARETRSRGIDWWLSKYGAANIGARLGGARSVAFNDDDYDVIPLIAWTSYPFSTGVLVPDCTRMGTFATKAIRYPSFHELFYLHPNRFTPDPSVVHEMGIGSTQPYVIIRLSALSSHHDRGIRGVSDHLLREILQRLMPTYVPFLSSERPLPPELERFRFPLSVDRIHHALAFATCVIGDSQTMSSEAAVLGTPSLRMNDFVGRISVLQDLETFGLTFGFKPTDISSLLRRLDWLLGLSPAQRTQEFACRRTRMLASKTDPLPAFTSALRHLIRPTPHAAQGKP